ncbi:plastocyanin/azurin family copper-binding protein [Pontibacter burrus]|uniref:EfeO-type cupredoxin-like domain-containing protein n=1 Tax=Pontibacter burrus TaxID=2704466 RepID=A0A6B3LP84_9BACT|nr:plastocyanin/azurin family copper-binding protein [Pontibacter burrus]NEM97693.1 hypothetical protein [Pontibacter burrus]
MRTAKTIFPIVVFLAGIILYLPVNFTTAPIAKPQTHVVEIKQMKFNPAELTVNKGDTVVFVNKDVLRHDATETTGKSWKSPALASGQSWKVVATKSASYYCSFHPVMKGKIIVK